MFGCKGIAWRSVIIPRMLPKPDVMPLTGGYRKTPILQIGADVYIDTAHISRELERRFPTPPLFPSGTQSTAAIMAAWADRTLFFDVVGVVFGTLGATVPAEFAADRMKMSDGMMDPVRYANDLPHLRAQLRAHLFWLEHGFADGRRFLLGAAPTYPDFSVYAFTWMLVARVPPETAPLADMPQLQAWMQRMEALGHGTPTELSAKDALAIAAAATPAPVVMHHPEAIEGMPVGSKVTVAADDYGKDPVAGVLLGVSAQRIVIRRDDPVVGEVNLHFPRAGFRLLPAP
jgi:glutathione S-transferase